MPSPKIKMLGLFVTATLAACGSTMSPETVVEPSQPLPSRAPMFPVSRYVIPEDKPEGKIRITSFGVVPLEPTGGGKASNALHVRIVLANEEGLKPWKVDTRELRLSLPGEGESRPAFVNTDAGTPPIILVPPGAERTLDLFYPLPAEVKDDEEVDEFTIRWAVTTGSGLIVRRTPFEDEPAMGGPEPYSYRSVETSEPVYYESYPDYGYGYDYGYGDYWAGPYFSIGFGAYPYWYYDPFYPTYTFYSVPPIVSSHRTIVNAPRPVHIARPPSDLMPVTAPSHIARPPSVGGPRVAPMPAPGPGPAPMPAPSHIARPPSPGPSSISAPPVHAPMPSPAPSPPVHIARPPR
jgi:hypothetical protein